MTTQADTVEFDPFSDDYFTGAWSTYKRLRDEAPLYRNDKWDFWALSRYEDVAAAYKDTATFSSAKGATLDMHVSEEKLITVTPVIIHLDPPEHQVLRNLVNKVFTPRAIAALEEKVVDIVGRTLGAVDADAGFDLVQDFSALFPIEVITTMLGVPQEDREQIRHWLDQMMERRPGSIEMTPEGLQSAYDMGLYYYSLIGRKRQDLGDDMISGLIRAEVERDGEKVSLDDIEIAMFTSMLGGAGAETVTKLVANALVLFADHPEQWQQLRGDRDKIPDAVEEALRMEGPSQYNVRSLTRDIEIHGTTLPKDTTMLLMNGAALRDDRMYDDPDTFDINRIRPNGPNIAFGYGAHSCLGAALARLESRIAFNALLDLLPHFEIDRAGLQRVRMANVFGWQNVPIRRVSG
ncbi:cytochrome P450 [uncultured Williamsia sp.]|uniref:cytochrome P450 n=1 Tax=uncultured Williamsia sp. TaxID=259311 RepID=UPI002604E9B2|nr:cytochrome P450 [uncultured Williamsia sp.]